MARIRSVHPDLCVSETIEALDNADLEVTFVRLWTHCDDFGRCADNLLLIKAGIFPLRERATAEALDEWLWELADAGVLRRYEVDGKRYIAITSWHEFQHPNRPAQTSRFPDPPDTPRNRARGLSDASLHDHGANTLGGVKEGLLETEKEGRTHLSESSTALELVAQGVSPTATDRVTTVFDAWRESTGHHRAVLDGKRRRVIDKALRTHDLDDVVDAVRGWKHSPHHRGENDRHTVYDDLELLLRDASQIEKFRDLERGQRRPQRPSAPTSFDAIGRLGSA